MNSIRQKMTVITLCCAIMGCSADTDQSSVKYQEKDVDYSSASIGAFPQAKLSENMGAFILPENALKHLRSEDVVPPKESRIWQLCEQLNHHPNLLVSAATDEAVQGMTMNFQQNQRAAVCFLWIIYAFEREILLTKLSATGMLSAKEVNDILKLNVSDVFLRTFDPEYSVRMPQIINQVNASIVQNQAVNVQSRVVQLQEQFQKTAMQAVMSYGMEKAQQNQAVMDMAIDGLNQIRARNKQRRDNFWAWRERKLKTQVPTLYGLSGICRYCGGLVTVGTKCPVASDGIHVGREISGPKMIDPSHEGVRAR